MDLLSYNVDDSKRRNSYQTNLTSKKIAPAQFVNREKGREVGGVKIAKYKQGSNLYTQAGM